MVDLSEVSKRIEVLDKFVFEDDQPNVEGPVISVLFDSSVDFRYADRAAFDSRWSEELQWISQLKNLIKEGDYFVNMLYTYRSISKALRVKAGEEANKNEMYTAMYEVLEPEIEKLKKLKNFQTEAIKSFSEHVKRVAALLKVDKKKEVETFPSQQYLWYIIQMLDRFALLDDLKNMKACLNNDFAFYKRAFQFLRKTISGNDDQNAENHTLYLFLAHQNSITSNLKIALQAIPGYDDVISETINCAADLLDNDIHMLPSEKYALLRIMPFGLLLMDGDQNTGGNVFKTKKVKMSRVANIFKRYPVVPLYGDMQITLESVLRRGSPHFVEATWATTASTDAKQAVEYELIHHLESVRTQYNEYVAKYSNMINELKTTKKDPKQGTSTSPKEVYAMVLQGLLYLSDWSSKILQQAAWKFAKPNNDASIGEVDNYERVVRYNYKPEEKFALVEFLGMVKTLATLIVREDSLLSPIVKTFIHHEVQEFVQLSIRDAIRKTVSKKRTTPKTDLLNIRSIGADWYGGLENTNDPVLQGKKPAKDERMQLPTRSTPPSPTQLALLRMITFGLINSKKKDWKEATDKEMESFFNKSFFYDYLLNLSGTIMEMTDMGDLWYREFYLELGKKLQFPIDMSLPWILTDHILETKDASMLEFLFYPLDIYNDSANRALKNLNKQFLYDEIEAEVNLCFDQLVYKLSEQIFVFYKSQASSILMDKAYKGELEVFYQSVSKLQVPKSRYDVIVKQRHIQLLGRSIDLNLLISQRMNTYLRQNIDFAIARFEASDLTGIMELESLLSNIQLTYFLMAEYFSLDPWEDILKESNESVSLVSFHGRIVLHTIFELMYDFAPNYNFNTITNRFVPTPRSFVEKVPRDSMPKVNPTFLYGSKTFNAAYANSAELFKNFIGLTHVAAIVKLVGPTDLPLIVSECLQNMDLKIRNVLAPYVKELFEGMPSKGSKLPAHAYGTAGGYGFYELQLKEIKSYPELQSEVLRNFKEVGNWIIFLNMCELALSQHNLGTFRIAAPFLGVTTENVTQHTGDATQSPLYSTVHNLVQFLGSKPQMSKAPAALQELVANAWRADQMYRPAPQNFSLFKAVLRRISQMLDSVRHEWSGGNVHTEKGVLPVDYTTEFYRLWSAFQFISCMPTAEGEMSNQELFGDGLFWAGASMIHFLGQRNRFEVLDFNLHILHLAEALGDPSGNADLAVFLSKAVQVKDLNHSIFTILNTYAPYAKKEPTVFSPPEKDISDTFMKTNMQSGRVTMRPVSSFISAPPTGNSSASSYDAPPPPDYSAPPSGPPPPPVPRPPPRHDDFDAPPPPPMDDFDAPPPPPDEYDAPPPFEDFDAPPPPPDDFPPPPPPDF